MSEALGSLMVFAVMVWAVGAAFVWPFWYFGCGVNKAKRSYGIDWRQFRWSYFGCGMAWPYFLFRWFQRRETGEKMRAVVFLDGEEVRMMLNTAQYEINDRCEATTRTQPLARPSERTSLCAICGEDMARLKPQDRTTHFLYSHIDDAPGTGGQVLELQCGCPHMQWPAVDLRTEDILPHMQSSHGLKV